MIPLYNHADEKWLIGALLQDPDLQKRLPALPTDLMHDSANAMILAAMADLQASKAPIELLSVSNALAARGQLDQVGGQSYLIDCVRCVPTTATSAHYLRELNSLMDARNAFRLANSFCHQLTDGQNVDAAIDDLRTKLRNLVTPTNTVTGMGGLAQVVYDDIERRSKGEQIGLKTYIPDLDRLIDGMEPGDLTVIGARPAVGKSAFGMQIGLNVAARGGHVLVCSREMSRLQYAQRVVSNLSGINGRRLKRGSIRDDEWDQLADACARMGQLPISFTFDSATVEELRVQAQQQKDLGRLDLLIVDYLQILKTGKRAEKRYEAVGAVSRSLKEIALDLQIPVIAMSQVGRQTVSAGSDRAPVMPDLSDLRESGNIEQDADIVIFLHHPMAESDRSIPSYDLQTRAAVENTEDMQYIVVRVAKQRQGECGSFGVAFDGAHMTYTCIER